MDRLVGQTIGIREAEGSCYDRVFTTINRNAFGREGGKEGGNLEKLNRTQIQPGVLLLRVHIMSHGWLEAKRMLFYNSLKVTVRR